MWVNAIVKTNNTILEIFYEMVTSIKKKNKKLYMFIYLSTNSYFKLYYMFGCSKHAF